MENGKITPKDTINLTYNTKIRRLRIINKMNMFIIFGTPGLLLIATQKVFGSSAANQLINEGEKVKNEIITFISDGFSKIVHPF